MLAPRPRVQHLLETAVETEFGPIDATLLSEQLTEDEQCDFFSRVPNCQTLIFQNWRSLPEKILRCISFSIGDSITGKIIEEKSRTDELTFYLRSKHTNAVTDPKYL